MAVPDKHPSNMSELKGLEAAKSLHVEIFLPDDCSRGQRL